MTTNEIAVRTTQDLAEKMEWAKAMAVSTLLPKHYQSQPGNLLFAIEYADALGVERINAITEIFVIDGKPSASANLIAGLIRKAGHVLRVEGDDTYAKATLIRKDDPENPMIATWNMEKARQAGLTGKSVWKAYPGAMLRSRAITEVARMGATDATLGLVYTAEELGAEVDAQGNPIKASGFTSAVVTGTGPERMRSVLGVDDNSDDKSSDKTSDTQDAEIVNSADPSRESEDKSGDKSGDNSDEGFWPEVTIPTSKEPDFGARNEVWATEKQIGLIGVLMEKAGITEKSARLGYAIRVTGRLIESATELTSFEASKVIDALKLEAGDGE